MDCTAFKVRYKIQRRDCGDGRKRTEAGVLNSRATDNFRQKVDAMGRKIDRIHGPRILTAIMLPVPLSSPTVDGHRVTRELSCGDKWSNDFLGVFQRLEPIDIDKKIA